MCDILMVKLGTMADPEMKLTQLYPVLISQKSALWPIQICLVNLYTYQLDWISECVSTQAH